MSRPAYLLCGVFLVSCVAQGTVDRGNDPGSTTAGATTDNPPPGDLLTLTSSCNEATHGRYATDDGEASTVAICRLNGGFFWKADMDIDCDGKRTSVCNENTDDAYQNQTSADDSNGNPLD